MGDSMSSNTKKEEAGLQIDAHVIRQLGDQLISDSEQALLELVKNSFDADAEWAKILIATDHEPAADIGSASRGMLVVEDNGTGMDLDAIKHGWLTISLSPKREMKASGKVTVKFRRTPLGDKGLGRLGTMKLGEVVEIITHSDANKEGYRVRLKWSEFQSGRVLSQIKVPIVPVAPIKRTGTRLSIYGLNTPDFWKGEKRLSQLQTELSGLVSPFDEFANFRWTLAVDGKRIELRTLTPDLRETATTHFAASWDDTTLRCTGKIKLSLFRTEQQYDESFSEYVESDRGQAFFEYLSGLKGASGFNLERSKDRSWYLNVERSWTWDELASRRPGGETYAPPGPFRSEIDSFDLDAGEVGQKIALTKISDYKNFIKKHAGVMIYRDGFAVRMREDWLGLGKSWTSGRSYYGLRPSNALGFVAISSAGNPLLLEKSDREGFIDTAESRGFFELLSVFVKFCNDSLNFLRRSYNGYRGNQNAGRANLPEEWRPVDALHRLQEIASTAKEKKRALEHSEERRVSKLRKVRAELSRALSKVEANPRLLSDVEQALQQFDAIADEWSRRQNELTEALSALSDQGRVAELIVERFDQLNNQISEVYETVGIGLVAQAFAHDVHALIDDLLSRTQKISRRPKVAEDPPLVGYLEAVRVTANSLRKQLTLLDPMLRSARETRQETVMSAFIAEFVALRTERAKRLGIEMKIDNVKDFSIRTNKGRLIQIVDNLFRNSEFWLLQHRSSHPDAESAIHVEIASPYLVVWDTGPGIKRAIEDTLFDIFVTDKPKGEGNGLGLFIVSQLLAREGCSIRLEPKRNAKARRYRFSIDFSEIIQNER